jgi:hypothetical protein
MSLPTLQELKSCSYVPNTYIMGLGLMCGARLFRFKNFKLLSAAIGTSADERIIQSCRENSDGDDGFFNTWYFNSGDMDFDTIDAKKIFHWWPVKHNPIWNWSPKPFEPIRDQLAWMISTAEEHGYLAMGCDGNKHRGPSVFAMFLSLAGYEPKIATDIANHFFGSNFVMHWVRARIARLGWELGNQRPDLRLRAAKLLEVAP